MNGLYDADVDSDEVENSRLFCEGQAAMQAGIPLEQCPHSDRDAQFAWCCGWSNAQAELVHVPFPPQLQAFIDAAPWRFAKTMPVWPHEYIMRYWVSKADYEALYWHIFTHGKDGPFYQETNRYFRQDGKVYWIMTLHANLSIVINRCREEDSYEYKLANGTLPQYVPVSESKRKRKPQARSLFDELNSA